MTHTILVVDDEPDMLALLKRSLEPDLNCQVDTVTSAEQALERLSGGASFDLVLADIKMQGIDGLELLHLIKQDDPLQTVVMMTAYGHIELAVKAMKLGAYDFITKPFEYDTLVVKLEKALERSRLIRENHRLQHQCADQHILDRLVGKSPAMQQVFNTIKMVADAEHTVLITGESGTGKDLTARAIHTLSRRSSGPYIPVNCPTVPENILESELFGYKKGAFTHATQNKRGLFQEAHGGTIFLDEIGDINPTIQTKLLRVLQEKEIKPLGATRSIQVDVRIIASTNQDLMEKIHNHQFREDVFYRLNVLPIHLPPLRERVEDIPLLANHLLHKHAIEINRQEKSISSELMAVFQKRHWKGNVRELENIVIRGLLYSTGEEILPADAGLDVASSSAASSAFPLDLPYKAAKEDVLRRFTQTYIDQLLSTHQGNVTQAARDAGMERQALQQLMKRFDIPADRYRG